VRAVWQQAQVKAQRDAQAKQISDAEPGEKLSFEDQAYRIWLKYYRAEQQGKLQPLPVLTIPESSDAKEADRMQALWKQAQRRALVKVGDIPSQAQPDLSVAAPVNNFIPGFNRQSQGIAGLASAQIATSMKSAGINNVAYADIPGKTFYNGPAANQVN